MNIAELLNNGEDIPFTLDGKKHEIHMQPPTASVARELRDEFYKLGGKANDAGDKASASLAVEFESVIAKIVKACFPSDSEEAKMDDDTARLFVLRIGGDRSEVVKYALRVCGIRMDIDADSDASGDNAF